MSAYIVHEPRACEAGERAAAPAEQQRPDLEAARAAPVVANIGQAVFVIAVAPHRTGKITEIVVALGFVLPHSKEL